MKRLITIATLFLLTALFLPIPTADAATCVRCVWDGEVRAYICDLSYNAPPNNAEWGNDCQLFDYSGWTFCNVSGTCGYDPGFAMSGIVGPNFAAFLREATRDAERKGQDTLRLLRGGATIYGKKVSPAR